MRITGGDIRSAAPWHEQRRIAYALIMLAAALLVTPAAGGAPLLHDSHGINWVWADQFTAELRSGNPLPRWLPQSHGGLGSPVFYYYPPLAFYVAGLFGLTGLTTYASLVATFGAAFALLGVSMWHWLEGRSAQPLLGALAFVVAPYHLFDFVQRGALAESFAIAIIPLVAIGIRRIGEGKGPLVGAVAYAALIMAHLPLALLASLFLIAPYGAALILKDRRTLVPLAVAALCGIGLAAAYLMPALALDEYRDSALLYRLPHLTTAYWTIWNADFRIGQVRSIFLIIAALALVAGTLFAQRRDFWSGLAMAVLLLSIGVVPGFWSLPLLEQVQFPYRVLPIAEFAIVSALAGRTSFGMPLRPLLFGAAALSGVFLLRPSSQTVELDHLRAQHPDVVEYLPRGALPSGRVANGLLMTLSLPEPLPSVPGMAVERRFYFPAWSCGMPEPRTKLLMHELGCRPKLIRTPEERAGFAVSILSALALIGFLLINRLRPGWTQKT